MDIHAPDPAAGAAGEPSARERIEAWCRDHGYDLGCYGSCGHSDGLPGVDHVRVRPSWSPVDGDHVILVTPDQVIQAVCPHPWGDHDWHVRAAFPYADTEQLRRLLDRLVQPPRGCWR